MDYGRGGDAVSNPHADYFVLRPTAPAGRK